jgi:hypothetical protein
MVVYFAQFPVTAAEGWLVYDVILSAAAFAPDIHLFLISRAKTIGKGACTGFFVH